MAKKKAAKKKSPAKKAAKKKAPAKKAAKKKAPAKKAAKKKAPAKKAAKKKAPAKKAAKKKSTEKVRKTSASAAGRNGSNGSRPAKPKGPVKMTPFLKAQKQRLLDLRDSLVDAMAGVAQDNLRGTDGADSSAFGMHQADAGSDAYDRDFALNLLSQEQDALYEIDEALGRIKLGSYGVCEISGKKIMRERLEAIPFARFTVECQAQLEREQGSRGLRRPITPQMFDSDSGVDSDS